MKFAVIMISTLFTLQSFQVDPVSRGWRTILTSPTSSAVEPLSGKEIDQCKSNYYLKDVNADFRYSTSPAELHLPMAQDNDETLFARIERAIKMKEPEWELVTRDERKDAVNKYFTLDWTLGDEYLSTSTYEMIDSEEASRVTAEYVRSPISVTVSRDRVSGLGDEAYTLGEGPYGKKGSGTLIVRRGKIMIRLDASSLATAQRFARHMLEEVDVR